MRALITGGAGFIGSHLADHLIDMNHEVIVVDNLSTGNEDNLVEVRDAPGFTFHIGDVRDSALMYHLVNQVDCVFHLAAVVGVKRVLQNPAETIMVNSGGTETVLEACRNYMKPVLLASSSEVYGKSTVRFMGEMDDLVLGPTAYSRWGYACSKALDEWLGFAFAREYNLPVAAVRFFNIVGPRQTAEHGMVLPTFVGQALANEDITIYGSGDQRRTFTHVLDAVIAITGIMARLAVGDVRAVGHAINVGATESITIRGLAGLVRRMLDGKCELKFISYEDAYEDEGFEDMMARAPDVTALRELIGFVPKLSLERIIEDIAGSM